jgi:predicted Zn-dependent peptidase
MGTTSDPRTNRRGGPGFAHLFEHLMFMGSRNAPYPAFDSIMESWGGHNNGTTSNDRTNYYEIGPRNLLETFLWLEADRLATLPDVITDEELERQRKVVQNERRQSYENRPYARAELAIPEAMYPAEHPYHWPTIGSHADLEAATVADVRAFFERFYRPSNASLVIGGDFDPALARDLVERFFGWQPKLPPPTRAPLPAEPRAGARHRDRADRSRAVCRACASAGMRRRCSRPATPIWTWPRTSWAAASRAASTDRSCSTSASRRMCSPIRGRRCSAACSRSAPPPSRDTAWRRSPPP